MRRQKFVLVLVTLAICILVLLQSSYGKLHLALLQGDLAKKLSNLSLAVSAYQKAVKVSPNNETAKLKLDKAQKSMAFMTFVDNIKPNLIEFKSINTQWYELNVKESNRTIDDLSAAKEINEKLIPRLDRLLAQTAKVQSLGGIEGDLVTSIKLTREAYLSAANMLNGLSYSKSQDDKIQKTISDAYQANKKFLDKLESLALELDIPASDLWAGFGQ